MPSGACWAHFEDFLNDGPVEEKQFLGEVFEWWGSGFAHNGTKQYGEHEIPLFSAIQDRLNGMHLVPVESEAMVQEVEEFITAKIESGWESPQRKPYVHQSEDEINARLKTLLTRQIQYFASRCKKSDLIVLDDLSKALSCPSTGMRPLPLHPRAGL